MRSINSPIQEVAGYQIIERIGAGGMGDVYKAHHPGLQRMAAVKILYQKEMADRFKNEAFIQSSVAHPNIARLYDTALTGSHPCIIMEYVEGETLDSYLKKKGKISSAQLEEWLSQIVAALTYLHQRDIIHRDLKPQNFKLQPDGTIKMLDFGIAKHKYSPKLTQLGFVVGTTEYMSPEQFQQQVEKKSDIWALGIMTYEMVTGYMPFEDSNPVTLRYKIAKAIYTDPTILVPGISGKLKSIIEKSLRCNPSQRISAPEIAALLKRTEAKKVMLPRFSIPAFSLKTLNLSKIILPELKFDLVLKNKPLIITCLALCCCVIMAVKVIGHQPVPGPGSGPTPPNPNKKDLANTTSISIYTPSVNNAKIVFANGETQELPFKINGKEGDKVQFIIRAEGYEDKKVDLDIISRRSSYEYHLEKLKDK